MDCKCKSLYVVHGEVDCKRKSLYMVVKDVFTKCTVYLRTSVHVHVLYLHVYIIIRVTCGPLYLVNR